MNSRLLLVLAWWPSLLHADRTFAAAPDGGGDRDVVAEAMWSALSTIHTGAGAAKCFRRYGPVNGRHSDYKFAFDFDSGCSRIDRTFPARGQTIIRVDSPEETISSLKGSLMVERLPPGAAGRADGHDPFDVRILGLMAFGEFAISNDDMTCRTLGQLRAHLEGYGTPRVSAADAGDYSIEWGGVRPMDADLSTAQSRYERYMRIAFVSPDEGFVPKRTEVWFGWGPTPEITATLYAVTKTEWKKIADAAVPVKSTYDIVDTTKHAEITLEWDSVNGEIEPRLFTVDGLGAPKGTIVADHRIEPGIIERVIGRPARRAVKHGDGPRGGRSLVTAVSIAVTGLVFVLIVVHQIRRSRAQS